MTFLAAWVARWVPSRMRPRRRVSHASFLKKRSLKLGTTIEQFLSEMLATRYLMESVGHYLKLWYLCLETNLNTHDHDYDHHRCSPAAVKSWLERAIRYVVFSWIPSGKRSEKVYQDTAYRPQACFLPLAENRGTVAVLPQSPTRSR
ncbi:hypothetical protein KVV02_002328 [Mortierella alpina]|uniref:Uncharacterized protein n=1 Tax=Mortierella alpina TaxID=64518 RepID=A0A9P8A3B4_MORAP|nr:hypothetical protein KVV02_002328 [Mortierella alpina]